MQPYVRFMMLSDELCSLNHIQNHADVAVQLLHIILLSYIHTSRSTVYSCRCVSIAHVIFHVNIRMKKSLILRLVSRKLYRSRAEL